MPVTVAMVRELMTAYGLTCDPLIAALERIEAAEVRHHVDEQAERRRAKDRDRTKLRNKLLGMSYREWLKLSMEVFDRDNWICMYCGEAQERPQADHMMPLSKGGPTNLGNLVTACRSCNSSKCDRPATEWHGKV